MKNRIRIRICERIRKKFKSCGEGFYADKGLVLRGAEHMSIGTHFNVGSFFKLQAWEIYRKTEYHPVLRIGNNVSIMDNCQISCADEIIIGNGCLMGDNVYISDNYHGKGTVCESTIPPLERDLYLKGKVRIGSNVWLGRNVCVMPGVSIGDGAIIGANSVVTHDIPAHCVAAGVPAKIIRLIENQ